MARSPITSAMTLSVALAQGEPVAGIGCCPGGGHPAVWTPYFAVRDADETAALISERGATLAVGPLVLGGEGRAGIAADRRDGAVFGFWEDPALTWSVARQGPGAAGPADPRRVHMVSLAEARDSGASAWDADRRTRYANGLGSERSLVVVTAKRNRSKADKDPSEWLPPAESAK